MADEASLAHERGRSSSGGASPRGSEINEGESLLGGRSTNHARGGSDHQPLTPNATDRKGCCPNSLGTWISLLVTLVMAIAIIAMKIESDQRYVQLQTQVVDLQRQLADVSTTEAVNLRTLQDSLLLKESDLETKTQSSIQSLTDTVWTQNRSLAHQYHSVWDKLTAHDTLLVKLTNGTSNAEVLDKLQWTKQQVASQMQTTKEEITTHVSSIARNVSQQLAANQEQLHVTQSSIATYLNHTVHNMRSVMTLATNHIYDVQRNVTRAMNQTKLNVERTVVELSASVLHAQATIQDEVAEVRDHIESYVAVTNKQFAAENDFVKYQLAGLFTLLSCLIFLWHLTQHIRHFYKPDIQKRITAILWMVPVYGVTSWISMMQPKAENYLATIRDCYEAYVVYTFVAMLVAILGDGKSLDELEIQIANRIAEERREVLAYKAWQVQQRESLLAQQTQASASSTAVVTMAAATAVADVENNRSRHGETAAGLDNDDNDNDDNDAASTASNALLPTATPLREPKEHFIPPCPCCYRSHLPLSMAATWLWQCRFLALQFMFVKPLFTLIPLLLQITGAYNVDAVAPWADNTINWHSVKLYIIVIQNVSVGMAFYGLLSFYHGAEKDLEWCDPWPKFLTIKGIVFATFWQSICIQAMSAFGLVDEKAASQISNFLICVEMLIASIAHFYVFPHHEWHPTYQKQRERTLLIQDTMALRDFVQDMRSMMTSRRAASRSEETMEAGEAAGGVGGAGGDTGGGDAEAMAAVKEDTGRGLFHTPAATSSSSSSHGRYQPLSGQRDNDDDEDDDDDDDGDEERGVRMNLLATTTQTAPPLVRRPSPRHSHGHGPSAIHHPPAMAPLASRSDTLELHDATVDSGGGGGRGGGGWPVAGDSDDAPTTAATTTTAPLSFGAIRDASWSASNDSVAVKPPATPAATSSSLLLPPPRETDRLLSDTHHPPHAAGDHVFHTPRHVPTGGASAGPHHPVPPSSQAAAAAAAARPGSDVNRYVQEQLEKKLQLLEAIEQQQQQQQQQSAHPTSATKAAVTTPSAPQYYQRHSAASVTAAATVDTVSPLHPAAGAPQSPATSNPPTSGSEHASV